MSEKKPKQKVKYSNAMIEARVLVHRHRHRLMLGLGLMLINRMPGSGHAGIDQVRH